MKFRLPQNYFSKIMRAIVEFDMIERGDNILIGLSGGKDSLLLTYALAMMRERTNNKFSLRTLTIDPMFDAAFDTESLSRFCVDLAIPHEIHKVDIAEVIRSDKKNAPCFTCAFFRRGAINRYAKEHGCNKVAYAHHNDDAVETLFLSLLYEGRFHTFHPVTRMSRTGITVIRPLVYLPESHVKHMQKVLDLPVLKSSCPADGKTERESMSSLLSELKKYCPDIQERVLHALRNEPYDLWQKDCSPDLPDPDEDP